MKLKNDFSLHLQLKKSMLCCNNNSSPLSDERVNTVGEVRNRRLLLRLLPNWKTSSLRVTTFTCCAPKGATSASGRDVRQREQTDEPLDVDHRQGRGDATERYEMRRWRGGREKEEGKSSRARERK